MCLAVFGGGKNVAWLKADWVKNKNLIYWGDIDTWGLSILSDARAHQSHINAVMMDEATVIKHENKMSAEPTPVLECPAHLNTSEKALFHALKVKQFSGTRLEQERLGTDYIADCLESMIR